MSSPMVRTVRSFSSLSTATNAAAGLLTHDESLPAYTASPFISSENNLVSPSSSFTTGLTSPLGPIHHANPETVSTGMRVLCKLFPKTLLARRLQKAKEEAATVGSEIDEKARLKKEAEKRKKIDEIIERDRIIDHNLRMLGL